jgi:hypothetical protein
MRTQENSVPELATADNEGQQEVGVQRFAEITSPWFIAGKVSAVISAKLLLSSSPVASTSFRLH